MASYDRVPKIEDCVAIGSDRLELFQAEFMERKVGEGHRVGAAHQDGFGGGAMGFTFSKGRGESSEIQRIPAWCSLDLCLLEKTFS